LLPTNASSEVVEEVSEEAVLDADRRARDAMMAMTIAMIGNKALTIESDTASVDVVVEEEVLVVVDHITEDSIAEDLRETPEADHHSVMAANQREMRARNRISENRTTMTDPDVVDREGFIAAFRRRPRRPRSDTEGSLSGVDGEASGNEGRANKSDDNETGNNRSRRTGYRPRRRPNFVRRGGRGGAPRSTRKSEGDERAVGADDDQEVKQEVESKPPKAPSNDSSNKSEN